MSAFGNGRAMRRARLRRTVKQYRQDFGCTCRRTDVRYRANGPVVPGADHVTALHDPGCPAIVDRLYVLLPPNEGRCER